MNGAKRGYISGLYFSHFLTKGQDFLGVSGARIGPLGHIMAIPLNALFPRYGYREVRNFEKKIALKHLRMTHYA